MKVDLALIARRTVGKIKCRAQQTHRSTYRFLQRYPKHPASSIRIILGINFPESWYKCLTAGVGVNGRNAIIKIPDIGNSIGGLEL